MQSRLRALHHVDVPWRPADLEQREGRILRQGNQNDIVDIVNYVTEGTYDTVMWQKVQGVASHSQCHILIRRVICVSYMTRQRDSTARARRVDQ